MKKQTQIIIIIAIVLVVIIVLSSSIYIVSETRQVIITQFGEPIGDVEDDPRDREGAGAHHPLRDPRHHPLLPGPGVRLL